MPLATKEGLIKVLKGAMIAGIATIITYAGPQLMHLSYVFSLAGYRIDLTAAIVGAISILVNIARVHMEI